MPNTAITAAIEAAFRDAAAATGTGPLLGELIRLAAPAPGPQSYPPPPPVAPAHYPITCLFDTYSPGEIDGDIILTTDAKILVAAHNLPVVPQANDRISLQGKTYRIVNAPALKPGGVELMYEIQARL